MNKDSVILVTGSNGLVGKNLVESLEENGFENILNPRSSELDFRDQTNVREYFSKNKPEYVFHLAAKVGGIKANMGDPVSFLQDNLLINTNVIMACFEFKVKKMINLGSSCIYPKDHPTQPMPEEILLDGELEPTNEGYALAKISSLKLCEYYNKQYQTNFISLMPPNVYGKYEEFDFQKSHVISALIMKLHKAKTESAPTIWVWGTGNARREFIYVQDLVDAVIFAIENIESTGLYESGFLNCGTDEDISIKELAHKIKEIVGYTGEIRFDSTKPEGMLKKLIDSSRFKSLGFERSVGLDEGIKRTYEYYLETLNNS